MADQRKLTVVRVDESSRFCGLGLECVACNDMHKHLSEPAKPGEASDWVALTTDSGYFTGLVYCPECTVSIGILK